MIYSSRETSELAFRIPPVTACALVLASTTVSMPSTTHEAQGSASKRGVR
ncbi:hypothetical protein [Ktedonobacter racemifer]|nr:hypothetical protein [Ktedonobacter racemifer]